MSKGTPSLLIVDDEPDILEVLSYIFEKKGYNVNTASDGFSGIKMALELKPDIIILDIMMPGISGFEVCKKLRKLKDFADTIIIIFSAKNEEEIEKNAFKVGANDFITKPIASKILVKRVTKFFKTQHKEKQDEVDLFGPISIIHKKRKILIHDEVCSLNKKEYNLFKEISTKPGRVYSRDEILKSVWKSSSVKNIKELENTMKKLKKKIGKKYFKTIKGIGYKFEF